MAATAYAATSSSSMAAATTGFLPRVPTNKASPFFAFPMPYLPLSSSPSSSRIDCRSFSESRRLSSFQLKASSADETSTVDAGELVSDLKEKWDKVDNKSTVLLYGGGALVAIWLSSIIVGAVNSVPLLPKIMELVGLGYTGWFVYRYLLFKSSRKELAEDIEYLKKRIAGTEESSIS